MTTETHDETIAAADLLDENGRIDRSAVASRVLSGRPSHVEIDAEDCTAIRTHLLKCGHAGETAECFGYGQTAIRRHAKGECHHYPDEVDAPALAYRAGVGWHEVDR